MSQDGHSLLKDEMLTFDPQVTLLAADDSCEWVRSRMGIVGLIRVSEPVAPGTLRTMLEEKIVSAYAQLDALSENAFSLDDMWNVILLIAVPWTRDEAEANSELIHALVEVSRNLSGSRKILVWSGTPLARHLGLLAQITKTWSPSSEEPLREVVRAAARNEVERDALEVLFKRRITEADLDALIQALGGVVSK